MAISRKQEARALSADERELVEKSHHPAVQALADSELANVLRLTRERRDRARSIAERQRRELRGKADARGAAASKADDGSKVKQSVLSLAVRRLNSETERRRRMYARLALVDSANRALAMKQEADRDAPTFNTRHAHEGLRGRERILVKNHVPGSARGRVRAHGAAMQAKRDAR